MWGSAALVGAYGVIAMTVSHQWLLAIVLLLFTAYMAWRASFPIRRLSSFGSGYIYGDGRPERADTDTPATKQPKQPDIRPSSDSSTDSNRT